MGRPGMPKSLSWWCKSEIGNCSKPLPWLRARGTKGQASVTRVQSCSHLQKLTWWQACPVDSETTEERMDWLERDGEDTGSSSNAAWKATAVGDTETVRTTLALLSPLPTSQSFTHASCWLNPANWQGNLKNKAPFPCSGAWGGWEIPLRSDSHMATWRHFSSKCF